MEILCLVVEGNVRLFSKKAQHFTSRARVLHFLHILICTCYYLSFCCCCYNHASDFIFLKIIYLFIYLFREGKGGRSRGGEKYQCVVASHVAPTGDLAQQPRHVPWLGIEPATLWFLAHAQSAELCQPGQAFFFKASPSDMEYYSAFKKKKREEIRPGWCGSVDWARAANLRVTGSIPSQGTCLGCRPHPQWGPHERQPHIDISLSFSFPSPLSKNK